MKSSIEAVVTTVVSLLALSPPAPSAGQVADPDPARFADAIEEFERWDAKNTVPEEAILFVGSSSIRFWDTAEWFPNRTVVNRGFGGSHISDVNHYVRETVLKHEPDVVLFYAGDNDTAAEKTPAQIFEDAREFVSHVHGRDPATEIIFISIKPSLARWGVWPEMQEANALIREYASDRAHVHFLDVGSPMLGPDGEPIPELFVSDGLHMTDAGYEIWTEVVGKALREVGR